MKLSPTMIQVVEYMRHHGGVIHRHPGGFWARAEWMPRQLSFGTTSVHALVTRGAAEYCEWQEGRGGRFPIQARLIAVKPSPVTQEKP